MRTTGVLVTAITAGALLTAPAAHPVGGPGDASAAFPFTAEFSIGRPETGGRACSGALVAPQWVVTAVSCFADDPVRPGTAPKQPTTATIGRTVLDQPGEHVVDVTTVVPRGGLVAVTSRSSQAGGLSETSTRHNGTQTRTDDIAG
ncbi:trypsin-like serine protease [Saccharothrix australiensis]|uniref:trypsin-like serine protease n=1 Tax=Saccharothrix australiensis TaxID=2072 RepID=UPI001FE4696A|nr:trypsin-like serine protease [Saccharothrix australiensis]